MEDNYPDDPGVLHTLIFCTLPFMLLSNLVVAERSAFVDERVDLIVSAAAIRNVYLNISKFIIFLK